MAIVRAAQLRRFLVVGNRPDLAPESRSREKELQGTEHDHRRREHHERDVRQVEDRSGMPGVIGERPNIHDLPVRTVANEQQILDDDGKAERDEQRREGITIDASLNEGALHDVARETEDRHDHEE